MTIANTLAALVAERDAANNVVLNLDQAIYLNPSGYRAESERVNAAYVALSDFMSDNAPALLAQLQQRDKLVEALEFYRDCGNYNRREIFDVLIGPETPIEHDGGEKARTALEEAPNAE